MSDPANPQRSSLHLHHRRLYQSYVGVACRSQKGAIVSGSNEENVSVWDLASVQPVGRPLGGHCSSVSGVATSNRRIISASETASVATEGLAHAVQL